MMAARIFALGLVVTVEKGKDELISINYPLGLLEVRKFKSSSEVKYFWNQTKTPAIWRSRIDRMVMASVINGGQNIYAHVDSLQKEGIQPLIRTNGNEFYYELIIAADPKKDFSKCAIEISIGDLTVGHKFQRLNVANAYPISLPLSSDSYYEFLTSHWSVKIVRELVD
jgi:hypothetical protein